jgi:hypothetical protein
VRRAGSRFMASDDSLTLYKEQWLRLLDRADDIRAFIGANEAQLKSRQDK